MTAGLNPHGLSQADVQSTWLWHCPKGCRSVRRAADGLQSCSQAQIAMSSPGSPVVPGKSKIGTVQDQEPAVDGTDRGEAYLAAQNDDPFGSLANVIEVTARGLGADQARWRSGALTR